jgi:hypothetical protein
MSFSRQRFLGLTVVDFSSSIGWNDENSELRIKLAPENGEYPEQYEIGLPYNFSFGNFSFNGILERFIESKDSGGRFYEAVLSDGKEILRNVEVITTSFYGYKEPEYDCLVTNLLNVYRHFERTSFGDSGADDSGLKLQRFCEGVRATSSNCGIWHKGIKYTINIDNLVGILPEFYRVPGTNVNLLDAISTICDDAGYNYYIRRVGYEFQVFLSSLNSGAANNQNVSNLIAAKSSERNTISFSSGSENANNVISNFVLYGGNLEEAIVTTAGLDPLFAPFDLISSFWGRHPISGVPIKGYNDVFNVLSGIGGRTIIPVEWIDMPTLGVEDIIGDTIYRTNTLELSLVVGGKETWEIWLEMYKPAAYAQIYQRPPRPFIYLAAICTGGTGESNITRDFVAGENDISVIRSGRFYNFLKSMADGFYGKQFLIRMATPFGVRDKIESYNDQYDPDKKHFNAVPSDTGFLDPTNPFVQTFANFNDLGMAQSQNEEGKTFNWAIYRIPAPSFSFIGNSEEVIVSNSKDQIAVKANVNEKWVYWSGYPHFHITVSQPAFELQDRNLTPRCAPVAGLTEEVGYPALIHILFGAVWNTSNTSGVKFKIGPFPIYPTTTINHIKSEYYFYGPWIAKFGNGGKTKFEQDASITPWVYGSRQKMSEVSSLRIKDSINYVENIESGQYTQVGLPNLSLGDEIVANGPRVTGINVTYSASGVTTSYTVRTYVPRFGFLPKQSIDNVKRLAQKVYNSRRFLLKQYFQIQRIVGSVLRTFMGAGVYNFNITWSLGKRHDRNTPSNVISMHSYNPKETIGSLGIGSDLYNLLPDNTKNTGGFSTKEDAIKDLAPTGYDQERPFRSVVSSIDAVFRPFSNTDPGSDYIPMITSPYYTLYSQSLYINRAIPTSISYNPYKVFNDIDLVMQSNNFTNWDNQNFPTNYTADQYTLFAKGVSLKGPLMLTGWGTALTGEDQQYLVPNLLNKFPWQDGSEFKTGPVDLLWDEIRGVWTSHDVAMCIAAEDISGTPAGFPIQVGLAYLYVGQRTTPSSNSILVHNIGLETIYAGDVIIANYDVYNNRWVTNKSAKIRFWEQCAAQSQGEDYFDFLVEEGAEDPLDCAENPFNPPKVTIVKTDGFNADQDSPVLIPRGTISCNDGTVHNVYDHLIFWHGLLKDYIGWEEQQSPCDQTSTTTSTTCYPEPYFLCRDFARDCYQCSPESLACSNLGDGEYEPWESYPDCEGCNAVLENYNTNCYTGPDICMWYDSSYDPGCYVCQRCDTPPDGLNRANPDKIYSSHEKCYQDVPNPENVCSTTTEMPGCYLVYQLVGSNAEYCYQCTSLNNTNFDDPTIDLSFEPVFYDDCNECYQAAEDNNVLLPEDVCQMHTCLYQREDNDLCYYCGECDPEKTILEYFSGDNSQSDCQLHADAKGPLACITTEPPTCMYVGVDPDNLLSGGTCYVCVDCSVQMGPDFEAADPFQYATLNECNAAITDVYGSIECTSTTPIPCGDNVGVRVVKTIVCNGNGLDVTYADVVACPSAPSPSPAPLIAQSNFQTLMLKAEIRNLKSKLNSIFTALEKLGVKIEDAI